MTNQSASEAETKTNPKPTDSEQLENKLTELKQKFDMDECGTVNENGFYLIKEVKSLIQERDQQRLAAALEALPKKRSTVNEMMSFREAHQRYGGNQVIDQCKAALTAALGPDNSNVEEKNDTRGNNPQRI